MLWKLELLYLGCRYNEICKYNSKNFSAWYQTLEKNSISK